MDTVNIVVGPAVAAYAAIVAYKIHRNDENIRVCTVAELLSIRSTCESKLTRKVKGVNKVDKVYEWGITVIDHELSTRERLNDRETAS